MTSGKNKSKVRKPKEKTFSITLNEKECDMLKVYAGTHRISRPEALRRMVRDTLKQEVVMSEPIDKNQLKLFDTLQVDIFDNVSKSI